MLALVTSQAYNVFSYLVLDLGFSPVTLSVGGYCCIDKLPAPLAVAVLVSAPNGAQTQTRCRPCRQLNEAGGCRNQLSAVLPGN